ncbi:MAG: regulatory protein RecX [Actinomycetota bacterium]
MPAAGGKTKDCHERALGLLAVRQRSRRELERRLLQAGFEPTEVSEELSRLETVGLIDDEAFARAVAEHGFGGRKEARRVVAGKLATAGVDPTTAQAVLDDLAGDEQERADALASQRASKLGGLPSDKAFQRLAGFLARRGYPPGVARAAARRALAVEGSED